MELFADAYQQLASISAVLGGLAFTAAAALLAAGVSTSDPEVLGRPARVTVACAVVSAVCLIVAALMWSFMAADLSRALARREDELLRPILRLNWIPSIALLAGALGFFVGIGASGWIASRRLGWLTTAAAALGVLALGLMVTWFADLR